MATPILTTAACNSRLSRLSAIDGTDCIGDSRLYINENFINIATDLCSLYLLGSALSARPTQDSRVDILSSIVFNLSGKDTPTINLDFNSTAYALSANVVDGSIGSIKLGQDISTFSKRILTASSWPLSALGDVQFTSLTNNQVLKWDSSIQKWTNQTDVTVLSGLLTDGNKVDITVSNFGQTWNINDDAVDQNAIASGAVQEEHIYQGSVTETKLGPNAVSDAKLKDGAVTTPKLCALAVTQEKIGTGAVTTDKILDASSTTTGVTNSKLRHSGAVSVIGRSVNTNGAPADIQASANNQVLFRAGDVLQFGTLPNAATTGSSAATPSTLVLRDSSGNFAASNITATTFTGSLVGNANTATNANYASTAGSASSASSATTAGTASQANQLTTARNIALAGAVTGNADFSGAGNITINTSPGPGLTTNYFRATEVYASTRSNKDMSIRTLYAGSYTTNINNTPTAAGTTLDSRPTNVWRRLNTVEYSASFASINQFNNAFGTYIEINQPGLYEIHAGGTLAGARNHCVLLLRFNPAVSAPTYEPIATGTIMSNDPNGVENSSTSIVGGRFNFTGVTNTGNRSGVALVHIYRNDEKVARDVLLGSESFPSPWNSTWLTNMLPNVVTAWFEVKKIS